MDDGQFVRDLGELGQALCEADAGRLKTILADSKTARRIERELEVVLPFYLPLLADSINRRGEETHLTSDELATLLVSHGTEGIVLKPKLLLESGRFGFALMQAAAALAELDDLERDLSGARRGAGFAARARQANVPGLQPTP